MGPALFCKKMFCKSDNRCYNDKELTTINAYDFAYNFLREKLDITSYIKLQSSFETLQLFNYNEFQQLAFKNLRKPNLFSEEDKVLFNLDSKEDLTFDEPEKIKESLKIISYFSNVMKNHNVEFIDEKLFEMLAPKYKNIIYDEIKNE